MKPPGKTSLNRMQLVAMLEAERIEMSQDARVLAGQLAEPMPDQVEKRDDFAGMVRLIDAIQSDETLLDLLKSRMAQIGAAKAVAQAALAPDDTEVAAE